MSAERERKLQESVQKEQEQMQSVRMKFNMTQGWHDSFIKSPKSKLGKKQGRQQSETHSTIEPPQPKGLGAKSRSIAALNPRLPASLNPKFQSSFSMASSPKL